MSVGDFVVNVCVCLFVCVCDLLLSVCSCDSVCVGVCVFVSLFVCVLHELHGLSRVSVRVYSVYIFPTVLHRTTTTM